MRVGCFRSAPTLGSGQDCAGRYVNEAASPQLTVCSSRNRWLPVGIVFVPQLFFHSLCFSLIIFGERWLLPMMHPSVGLGLLSCSCLRRATGLHCYGSSSHFDFKKINSPQPHRAQPHAGTAMKIRGPKIIFTYRIHRLRVVQNTVLYSKCG